MGRKRRNHAPPRCSLPRKATKKDETSEDHEKVTSPTPTTSSTAMALEIYRPGPSVGENSEDHENVPSPSPAKSSTAMEIYRPENTTLVVSSKSSTEINEGLKWGLRSFLTAKEARDRRPAPNFNELVSIRMELQMRQRSKEDIRNNRNSSLLNDCDESVILNSIKEYYITKNPMTKTTKAKEMLKKSEEAIEQAEFLMK